MLKFESLAVVCIEIAQAFSLSACMLCEVGESGGGSDFLDECDERFRMLRMHRHTMLREAKSPKMINVYPIAVLRNLLGLFLP